MKEQDKYQMNDPEFLCWQLIIAKMLKPSHSFWTLYID